MLGRRHGAAAFSNSRAKYVLRESGVDRPGGGGDVRAQIRRGTLCKLINIFSFLYKRTIFFYGIRFHLTSSSHPSSNPYTPHLILTPFPISLLTCIIANHRVPTPASPLCVITKAGRNHLNKEITPLLSTGIGERYSQTISNLGHAALLRRC